MLASGGRRNRGTVERDLFEDLTGSYDPGTRPVLHASSALQVNFSISLHQIMDLVLLSPSLSLSRSLSVSLTLSVSVSHSLPVVEAFRFYVSAFTHKTTLKGVSALRAQICGILLEGFV